MPFRLWLQCWEQTAEGTEGNGNHLRGYCSKERGDLAWTRVVAGGILRTEQAGYILKASQQDLLINWMWNVREKGVKDGFKVVDQATEKIELLFLDLGKMVTA